MRKSDHYDLREICIFPKSTLCDVRISVVNSKSYFSLFVFHSLGKFAYPFREKICHSGFLFDEYKFFMFLTLWPGLGVFSVDVQC